LFINLVVSHNNIYG